MTLQQYVVENGIALFDLARRIGYTPAALSMVITGRRKPSWRLMAAIRRATGGAVQPNDFFPPPGEEA